MDSFQHFLDQVGRGEYQLTLHGKQRMSERRISHKDIRHCAQHGLLFIQRDQKIRIVGPDLDGETLSLICIDEADSKILIITVF
ncbi:MAG: DUF4258 domain-containing protein [Pseudobdellovibrionaceae bacterium]